MKFKKEKLIFLAIFTVLGFIALQIPINKLVGSKVSFTLFDLFAPIAGAFLGTSLGIFSVVAMQAANLAMHGTANIDKSSLIRLIPTLFGIWFFARKEGKLLIIPALAIVSFNLNEVGRSVWYFSLFWLIPYMVWPFREKSLVARSLGATFTAHAVGGAIWIWAVPLPAAVWTALVPVVVMERGIFALGMSASYILMNNVLAFLSSKKLLPSSIGFDKKYLIKKA